VAARRTGLLPLLVGMGVLLAGSGASPARACWSCTQGRIASSTPTSGAVLRGAATAAPRADLLEVPGADHGFSRHQAALAEAIARWLGEMLARW